MKKMQKQVQRNKSRYIANICLVLMALGFIITLFFEETLAIKIIQGGFEAGLVGGLADWFAVTALFRHPLGIPIPHTALLPKNREKITNAMLGVAEKELLNKKSILEKVRNIDISGLVLTKIEDVVSKKDSVDQIKRLLLKSVAYVDKHQVKNICYNTTKKMLQSIDTKQTLQKIIDKTLENHYDEKLYSAIMVLIEKKASEEKTREEITLFIINALEKKAETSFFKMALKPLVSVGKEKLSSIVDKAISDILVDLKDPHSTNRKNVLSYIQNELINLKENELVLQQLDLKKAEYLDGISFERTNEQLVDKLFIKIHGHIQEDTFVEEKVVPLIVNLLSKLKNDEKTMGQLETSIKNGVGNLIEANHDKIGHLIKSNLDKLDNDQLTDMMENKIGKELSWIRVNGSLCGFLIGIILSLIKIFS